MLLDNPYFQLFTYAVMTAFCIVCIKLMIDGLFYNRFVNILSEHDPLYNDTLKENDDGDL